MHRWLVALTLAGCAPPEAPPAVPPPPGQAIAPRAWGIGEDLGRFGRGQAAQVTEPLRGVGELVATPGERKLVPASEHTALLVDRAGEVLALLAVPHGASVVLGEHAYAVRGDDGEHRFALPPPWHQRLRAVRVAGVAVPAELRDLPAPDVPGAGVPAAAAAEGASGISIAVDPAEPAVLYAELGSAALARVELRGPAPAWGWSRAEACDGRALAVAGAAVLCAAGDRVRATSKVTGAAAWEWRAPSAVSALAAAGEVALAFTGARAAILDARAGTPLGYLASDDGGTVHAAALTIGGTAWIVAVERGRLVARLPFAAMTAVWSRAIDGTVRAVSATGDGVLVELDDGDAYRVDVRTGTVAAVAGLGLAWSAFPDVLVGLTAGGPIPPADLRWVPPPPKPILPPRGTPPPKIDVESPPPFTSNPWPAPPAMAPSAELTFYDATGGVRARNDYALPAHPRVLPPAARGPAGSPLVVADDDQLVVVDVTHGDPMQRVTLGSGAPFATIVDGKPIVGAVIGQPLRVVLFSRLSAEP